MNCLALAWHSARMKTSLASLCEPRPLERGDLGCSTRNGDVVGAGVRPGWLVGDPLNDCVGDEVT